MIVPASLFVTFVTGIFASSILLYANYWQVAGVLLSLVCLPIALNLDPLTAKLPRSVPSLITVIGVVVMLTGEPEWVCISIIGACILLV